MVRISKILLIITIAFLALWQIPWCYAFFNTDSTKMPFTLYSGVYGDFISLDNKSGKMCSISADGKRFNREETDSILPFFYVRQLVTDDRLSDTIQGFSVNPREIQRTNFNFRKSAYELNAPKIELYPLLESLSKRVELEMSKDVFRITDKGIEFIKMELNEIDKEKSDRFTKAMLNKGFSFPSRIISGNPTVKKDYDEGFLIVDNDGKLFHFKQIQGRPYVRLIQKPSNLEIKNLFITEFRDRKTLGFIIDKSNRFYVLANKTYNIFDTGIEDCNLDTSDITIIGNMADWTLWLDKDNCREYYALNANDYTIIKKMTQKYVERSVFGLHFTSFTDKFVYPRF